VEDCDLLVCKWLGNVVWGVVEVYCVYDTQQDFRDQSASNNGPNLTIRAQITSTTIVPLNLSF
jgi:hypothetical protein